MEAVLVSVCGLNLVQLTNYFKSFTVVRMAFGSMPLLAVCDMISDMIQLFFVYLRNEFYKSAATLWGIVNLSFRFNMLFAVLHPRPTYKSLSYLYFPFLLLLPNASW